MNKLSVEKTELALDQAANELTSMVNLNEAGPLTKDQIDALVRDARIAQAEVAAQLVKAAFNSIGSFFAGIHKGIRAATAYDELARLSDRDLADIGIQRNEIAKMAFEDSTTRSATADLNVYGYGMKVARPTNDWVDQHAA
jgi:hypothetical protein